MAPKFRRLGATILFAVIIVFGLVVVSTVDAHRMGEDMTMALRRVVILVAAAIVFGGIVFARVATDGS